MNEITALLESNAFRTILAIVGIAVTVTLYRLNRKRKEFSYEVVRNNRLFQLDDRLKSRVQISLDGKIVQDLSLAIIDVSNTGNEPIRRDDFDLPFELKFGSNAEIISARIISAKPGDLDAHLSTTTTDVVLQPLLLNKGDRLSIEVITAESTRNISHSVRIVGIPEVKASIRPSKNYWELAVLFSIAIAFIVMGWFTLILQFKRNIWVFSARIDISISVFLLGFSGYVVTRFIKGTKRT